MNVQRVSHTYPAGAVQKTHASRESGTVTMGTPATMTHPTAAPDTQPVRAPRVSHGVEASLSKLSTGG